MKCQDEKLVKMKNLEKYYSQKTDSKHPISKVLKRNLFDLSNFADFLDALSAN
jgi:hypothetical protein